MAISFEKAFGIHQYTIGVRALRSEMLSSNMVNSDTPGYKAKDLDFKSALNNAMSPESKHVFLNMTDSRHKFAQSQSSTDGSVMFRTSNQPDVGDGNSVDSEVERTQFMRNNLEYAASLSFLNSKITSLRNAIKG